MDNIRRGFVEGADFQRLLAALPGYLKAPVEFLYVTGWRSHEMQTLRWRDVDFNASQIVLDPVHDKTGKGRVAPMRGRLLEMIGELARSRRPDCQYVFNRDGKPLAQMSRIFGQAAERAGLAGLRPHDLRRSAVRNLIRSKIPERIAMALTGHATRQVFDRYNIVSGADLAQAADLLQAYLADNRQTPAKVSVLRTSAELAKSSA